MISSGLREEEINSVWGEINNIFSRAFIRKKIDVMLGR
jgi:hypothetical protein